MIKEEFLEKCKEYGIELSDTQMSEVEFDEFLQSIKNIFGVVDNLNEMNRIIEKFSVISNT